MTVNRPHHTPTPARSFWFESLTTNGLPGPQGPRTGCQGPPVHPEALEGPRPFVLVRGLTTNGLPGPTLHPFTLRLSKGPARPPTRSFWFEASPRTGYQGPTYPFTLRLSKGPARSFWFESLTTNGLPGPHPFTLARAHHAGRVPEGLS